MDAATDWLTASVRGRSGRVLDFDGTNDKTIHGRPALTGNYTSCAWIKTSSNKVDQMVASNWTGSINGCHFLSLNNGRLYSFAGTEVFNGSNDLRDGKWHFVSVRRIGSTGFFNADGVETLSTTLGSNNPGASNLYIAARGDGGDYQNFPGQIAEVTMHNRALTVSEVIALYNLGPGWFGRREPRRRYAVAQAAGFKAYWNQRAQLLGGGLR